jgi:hypothetical protein
MYRLVTIFSLTILCSYLTLYFTNGEVTPIYREVLSAFLVIAALFGTLSFAFFNYIDGISKDLPSKDKFVSTDAFNKAVEALQALRKEVISNVILVITLLVVDRAALGLSDYFLENNFHVPNSMLWAILSLRVSCLSCTLTAAFLQLRGFVTANELRSILSKNK